MTTGYLNELFFTWNEIEYCLLGFDTTVYHLVSRTDHHLNRQVKIRRCHKGTGVGGIILVAQFSQPLP
jgi:hypothetical protein